MNVSKHKLGIAVLCTSLACTTITPTHAAYTWKHQAALYSFVAAIGVAAAWLGLTYFYGSSPKNEKPQNKKTPKKGVTKKSEATTEHSAAQADQLIEQTQQQVKKEQENKKNAAIAKKLRSYAITIKNQLTGNSLVTTWHVVLQEFVTKLCTQQTISLETARNILIQASSEDNQTNSDFMIAFINAMINKTHNFHDLLSMLK